jgi:hypothetical protein
MSEKPKQVTVEEKVKISHEQLKTVWKGTKERPAAEPKCIKKWNEWSPLVRADFVSRSKKAVVAMVQRDIPKKQWAQWEVTVKFCIEDVLKTALSTKDKTWEDKDGIGALVKIIVEGKEAEINPVGSQEKIAKMIEEIKV